MPLTPEQLAALQAAANTIATTFAAIPAGDPGRADRDVLVNTLHASAPQVYQSIYRRGISAEQASSGKKADLTARITELEGTNRELQEKLDETDLTAIEARAEAKFRAEADKANKRAEKAAEQLQRVRAGLARTNLKTALEQRGILEKFSNGYTREHMDRIDWDPETGSERLRDRDNPDSYVPIPQGKTVYQVLAEEAYELADPNDRKATADAGSEAGGEPVPNGGPPKPAAVPLPGTPGAKDQDLVEQVIAKNTERAAGANPLRSPVPKKVVTP